jgi:hypothetical protein
VDSGRVVTEQLAGQGERFTDAESEVGVEGAGDGEVEQGGVRNFPRDTALVHHHAGDDVMRQDIVGPLGRRSDGK